MNTETRLLHQSLKDSEAEVHRLTMEKSEVLLLMSEHAFARGQCEGALSVVTKELEQARAELESMTQFKKLYSEKLAHQSAELQAARAECAALREAWLPVQEAAGKFRVDFDSLEDALVRLERAFNQSNSIGREYQERVARLVEALNGIATMDSFYDIDDASGRARDALKEWE